jgi:transposase
MAEICSHFRLKDSKRVKKSPLDLNLSGMSISEAAENLNMSVTDFLTYIGRLEKEGKLKIKFL